MTREHRQRDKGQWRGIDCGKRSGLVGGEQRGKIYYYNRINNKNKREKEGTKKTI